jgi:hypothetical protein
MRSLRVVLLPLLALLLQACSASESADSASSAAGGAFTGGQTGSLKPSCGIAPLSEDGGSVPSGEQAFVLYTRGCPETPRLDELMISDAAGDPIEVQLEPLEDGVYLVKGSAVLTEGEYDVMLPEAVTAEATSLEVVESSPLPTTVGTLSRGDRQCDVGRILLRPSAQLIQYLPLTQFSYALDDEPVVVTGDYGTHAPSDGMITIAVDNCGAGPCFTSGHHRLTVYATIAGETAQPDPAAIEFDIRCDGSESNACTLSLDTSGRPRTGRVASWLMLGFAALLGVVMQWRRSRRST